MLLRIWLKRKIVKFLCEENEYNLKIPASIVNNHLNEQIGVRSFLALGSTQVENVLKTRNVIPRSYWYHHYDTELDCLVFAWNEWNDPPIKIQTLSREFFYNLK